MKYLRLGESINRTALLSKTSTEKVKKVKRLNKEGNSSLWLFNYLNYIYTFLLFTKDILENLNL